MERDPTIDERIGPRPPALGAAERARFTALYQALVAWYEPADALETSLVRSIATDMLLERRVGAVERRVLADRRAGRSTGRQCRKALADIKSWRVAVEQGWRRALAELEDCRAGRVAGPETAGPETVAPETVAPETAGASGAAPATHAEALPLPSGGEQAARPGALRLVWNADSGHRAGQKGAPRG